MHLEPNQIAIKGCVSGLGFKTVPVRDSDISGRAKADFNVLLKPKHDEYKVLLALAYYSNGLI